MYLYEDYFNKDKRKLPYASCEEEREEYLRLLDMILEGYLEHKGLHSETKLYSRGLLITEGELKGYFDMPPFLRERDVPDPLLAESSREAFDHIEGRAALTEYKSGYGISDIGKIFGLDRTELLAVILALACDIDRRYERIYGFLQDDVSAGHPTAGLLYALMRRITKREGAEESIPEPLDEKMFLFFFLPSEEKGLCTPLILNPCMLCLLTGRGIRDDILPDVALSVYEEKETVPVFFDDSEKELKKILRKKDPGLFFIENSDPETVLHLLFQVLRPKGESLYMLDAAEYFTLSKEKRDIILSGLVIRLKMGLGRTAIRISPDGDRAGLKRLTDTIFAECGPGKVFLYGSDKEPVSLITDAVPAFTIPEPDAEMRIRIWESFLGSYPEDDVSIPDFADCHKLTYGKIRAACAHAKAEAGLCGRKTVDREILTGSIRQMNSVDFSSLASCVNAAYHWEDIKLDPDQLEVLHAACDRYRLRNRVGEKWGLKRKNAYGNGVSILLFGPPGTGKTMAAQVIASELSLPLYRVDISRIFSKYIGETEKNLSVIFQSAAGSDVILFFDEADALFSKRTEISGSNDKYSNSETAYLLQKIEEYDGMSILATNYYQNFDNAFIRRITYAVHMESPDEERRYELWTSLLPEETETEDNIDFRLLAKQFDISGSNIKAILYSAAYMAGAQGKPLSMTHIAKALQYEYRKQGRLIDTAAFGPLTGYL